MPSQSNPSRSRTVIVLVAWALLAVPLASTTWTLIRDVPACPVPGSLAFVVADQPVAVQLVAKYDVYGDAETNRQLAIDWTSGEAKSEFADGETYTAKRRSLPGDLFSCSRGGFVDLDRLPDYRVTGDGQKLFVQAKNDPSRTVGVATFQSLVAMSVFRVPDSNRVLVTGFDPSPPGSSARPAVNHAIAELWEIDERTLQLRRIARWFQADAFQCHGFHRVSKSGLLGGPELGDPELVVLFASIDPSQRFVEIRRVDDGVLVNRLSLDLESTRSSTLYFDIADGLVRVLDGTSERAHLLDLHSGRWLMTNSLIDYHAVRTSTDDGRRRVACVLDNEDGRFLIVDDGEEANSQKFRLPDAIDVDGIDFIDDSRVAILSDADVFSVAVIDIGTGDVVAHHRPWSWAFPVTIAVVAGWVVWMIGWMVCSRAAGLPGWVDLLVWMGVPLVAMTIRLIAMPFPMSPDRLPLHYGQGISSGVMLLSIVWLGLGQTRWTLRALPFLGFNALLLVILGRVFAHDRPMAWIGWLHCVLPSLALLVVLACFRWRGVRVGVPDQLGLRGHLGVPGQPPPQKRIAVIDLLGLITVFAALFAGLSQVTPLWPESWQFRGMLLPTLGVSLITPAIVMIGLRAPGRWRWVGAAALSLLLLFIIAEPVWEFRHGPILRDAWNGFASPVHRVFWVCVASIGALLIPFRYRGHRAATISRLNRRCLARHYHGDGETHDEIHLAQR